MAADLAIQACTHKPQRMHALIKAASVNAPGGRIWLSGQASDGERHSCQLSPPPIAAPHSAVCTKRRLDVFFFVISPLSFLFY